MGHRQSRLAFGALLDRTIHQRVYDFERACCVRSPVQVVSVALYRHALQDWLFFSDGFELEDIWNRTPGPSGDDITYAAIDPDEAKGISLQRFPTSQLVERFYS